MKKLLLITASIIGLFTANVQAAELKEIKLEAVTGYYAEIDNMGGVNYAPEVYTWGAVTENYVLKEKKTILTFNTSLIPANAKIEYVYLYAGIEEMNGFEGMTSDEIQQYFMDYLVADFAPIGGFGGSYFPTAYDYYGFAIDSSPVESYGFWLMDQSSYTNINKYGFTQLRVGFKLNPALVNVKAYYKWHNSGSDKPQLLIRYSEQ